MFIFLYYSMKLLQKIFFTTFLFLIYIFSTHALDFTDKDYQIVDKLSDRFIQLIDEKPSLSAQKLVDAIISLQSHRDFSEKQNAILDMVVDDIIYEYELEEIYYWDFSMLPSDCYEDELYDYKDKICYYPDYVDSDLTDTYFHNDYWEKNHEDESLWWENQAIYSIQWDKITLIKGEESDQHTEIWKLFISLIPKDYRWDLLEFGVNNDPDWDTFAFVQQNAFNNSGWDLYVNLAAFYNLNGELNMQESIYTLIHEFAHIHTLNKKQVKYFPVDASDQVIMNFQSKCITNFIMEWCLFKNAYLESFINLYWKENFTKLQKYPEQEFDFYSWNESEFVSSYAATNPWEDIAETFTMFILKTKPQGNSVADQKILFFYNYPDLVKLRNIMKSRLDNLK